MGDGWVEMHGFWGVGWVEWMSVTKLSAVGGLIPRLKSDHRTHPLTKSTAMVVVLTLNSLFTFVWLGKGSDSKKMKKE